MAVYKYTRVNQEDSETGGGIAPGIQQGGNSSSSNGPTQFVPPQASFSFATDEDGTTKKRMPFCIGFIVLLAIVYVLSRTEHVECDTPEPVVGGTTTNVVQDGTGASTAPVFDIDTYRAERLAAIPPHIIECAGAEAGQSQEVCHLPREKRYEAVGQKGVTIWMTGLSGSGKSTIANAVEDKLVMEFGKHVYRLDGDNIRTGLNRDLGFTAGDRGESVRRVGEVACLFADSGVITMVSLVSPYREDRDAARKRHEDQGILFLEMFMDVPLEVVQQRDPKGLYKKVAAGELKHFTGVDDPYEKPLNAEINLQNYKMTIDESVEVVIKALKEHGVLEGGETLPNGLPMPDGEEIIDLHVPASLLSSRKKEAETLPRVLMTDIDVNWLQTIGEGWASPLKGFMREGTLLQALHHNSLLVDPYNLTANYGTPQMKTEWNGYKAPERVSMPIPITLAISEFTKAAIELSGKKAVSLTDKDGKILAILRNPEIYENRKEEIVTRTYGVIDRGHPYIDYIYSGGEYLIGGEIELLGRIRYNDGLDQYRLTARELLDEFIKRDTDAVFAFQTRNPTHAGHAYLMRTARERLLDRGYKNPVLWLSPLGGWTKEDDVPLDVRVKQHVAVLEEGMLDPATTVMAIWPAPMIYAGPTEVIFHAKSRRSAGAGFFVVGRDPAGMKGSSEAVAHKDDDLYNGDHGKYVLATSPGLGDMELLGFEKVMYDKRDHTMKAPEAARMDDFISISGSKMRQLARQGATPCPDPMPTDVVAANCVPQGFMVPTGWDIVVNYYQNIDSGDWKPWSKQIVNPLTCSSTTKTGQYGEAEFKLYFRENGKTISPWHDVPLQPEGSSDLYNMVTEIPMYTTAKMEVNKEEIGNPIMQDESKGMPRYYKYGNPVFNYGLLPQTFEDPNVLDALGNGGDNDPLDTMEIGDGPLKMGSTTRVKVLGVLQLIDGGETDNKIICIREGDKDFNRIHDMHSLASVKPGIVDQMKDWLKNYKIPDGKPANPLASEEPGDKMIALNLIQETHERYNMLKNGEIDNPDNFYLG